MSKTLLLLGALLIAFGFWFPRNASRFVQAERRVTATVMETLSGGSQMRLPFPASVLLRFEYRGAVYHKTVRAVDDHWAKLKVGDTVPILLGDTPGQIAHEGAVRDTRSMKILEIFCLAAGAILMAMGAFRMFR